MKLYTEEQVRKLLDKMDVVYSLDELTPIELPSDEEIEEASKNINKDGLSWENDFARDSFNEGAKWIKQQILNQNK
jgi:hypothetical protein